MHPHVEPLKYILLEWPPLPDPHLIVQIGSSSSLFAFASFPLWGCSAWRWPTPEVPCVPWAPIQTVLLLLRTSLAPSPCPLQRCPCSSRWGRCRAGLARSSRSVGSTPWFTPATSWAFSCTTATTMTCRTRWALVQPKKRNPKSHCFCFWIVT